MSILHAHQPFFVKLNHVVNISLNLTQPSTLIRSSFFHFQDAQAEDHQVDYYTPVIGKSNSIKFSFAFIPCHRVLPYEQIEVRVYKSQTNESCDATPGLEILRESVGIQAAHVILGKRHNTSAEAVIAYQVSANCRNQILMIL